MGTDHPRCCRAKDCWQELISQTQTNAELIGEVPVHTDRMSRIFGFVLCSSFPFANRL